MSEVTDRTLERARLRCRNAARLAEQEAIFVEQTACTEKGRSHLRLGRAYEALAAAASDLIHVHNTLASRAREHEQAQIHRSHVEEVESFMRKASQSATTAYEQRLKALLDDPHHEPQEEESALGDIARSATRSGRFADAERALRQLLRLRQRRYGEANGAYGQWLLTELRRQCEQNSGASAVVSPVCKRQHQPSATKAWLDYLLDSDSATKEVISTDA